MENKNFSVKCRLLAFNIVALGPVVSLELFVSRAYVCMLLLITHIIFTHGFFFGDAVSYTFLKRGSYVPSIDLVKVIFLEFDE